MNDAAAIAAEPLELRRLRASPWRVVEAQHVHATRPLVDTAEEQEILETLLERSKPPVPEAARSLHYLLKTPFRYPPLRHGSRFGRRTEPGIWYGAEALRTAFAEVAFYRLVFLEDSHAELAPLRLELTAFQARVATRRGLDLTRPPWSEWRHVLAAPTSHDASQDLGGRFRAAGGEALRAFSARDAPRAATAREARQGTTLAVLSPAAFVEPAPVRQQVWSCWVAKEGVELRRADLLTGHEVHELPRSAFEIDGRLARPDAS